MEERRKEKSRFSGKYIHAVTLTSAAKLLKSNRCSRYVIKDSISLIIITLVHLLDSSIFVLNFSIKSEIWNLFDKMTKIIVKLIDYFRNCNKAFKMKIL